MRPKTLWEEVRAALRGWLGPDDEEGEKAEDPALLFHALFTAPLVIVLLALATRTIR
jgi:hypothetical protein